MEIWVLFQTCQRLSPVTAWYNYIITATFEGLKQPLGLKQPQGLKQPLLVCGAAPVQCFQNCFKLFKIISNCYYIRSTASLLPNDCYLFDTQSWWSIQYLIAANKIHSFSWAHHCWSINLWFNTQSATANANGVFQALPLLTECPILEFRCHRQRNNFWTYWCNLGIFIAA